MCSLNGWLHICAEDPTVRWFRCMWCVVCGVWWVCVVVVGMGVVVVVEGGGGGGGGTSNTVASHASRRFILPKYDCFSKAYSNWQHTKHPITMTSKWARWRLKTPASRLFTQQFIQAKIKETIAALSHWPLCGEFTDYRRIPRTKGQ